MKKYLFTALTGLMSIAGASSALAAERSHGTYFKGHDWDPPANHQWDNRDNRDARRLPPGQVKKLRYAPRRGVAVREYVYYPQARAYYAPDRHRWYQKRGTRWVVTQQAPANVINLGNGISISLGASSPVVYDSYVVNHYREYR